MVALFPKFPSLERKEILASTLYRSQKNRLPLCIIKDIKRHQGDIKGSGLSIQGDIKDIKGSGLSIPIIYNNLALLFLQKQALNAIFWGKNSV